MKRFISIRAFCDTYGVGRTRTYDLIAAGRLQAFKNGPRTMIDAESADIWAGRGAILLDRKDGPGAENAFERALALDPSHRPAAEGLGRAQALVRGGSR